MANSSNSVWAVWLVCVLFVSLAVSGCGGGGGASQPSEADLRQALADELGEAFKVTDFNIEAMQNTGNEVEPNFEARYNAAVELTQNLYTNDGSQGDVRFMKLGGEVGDEAELFGTTGSVRYQGDWAHRLYIEGNPLSEFGGPLPQASETRYKQVIVRGSAEETAHFAALDAKAAELKAQIGTLPLEDMITDFYNTKGQWQGQFVIHEVMAHRMEPKSADQFMVHAKYSYRKPNASGPQGEDRRAFTVSNQSGEWQVVRMAGAGSGQI